MGENDVGFTAAECCSLPNVLGASGRAALTGTARSGPEGVSGSRTRIPVMLAVQPFLTNLLNFVCSPQHTNATSGPRRCRTAVLHTAQAEAAM